MKRLAMVFALMVAVATIMVPVSASAAFIGELQGGRAYWETQVGSFLGVDLPGNTYDTLAAYTNIALPYGGTFRTNEVLNRYDVGNPWATWNPYIAGTELLAQLTPNPNGAPNYIANFNFSPSGSGISSFGFEIEPTNFSLFTILLYTAQGQLYQDVQGNSGAKFFGWVDEGVTGFTVITYDLSSRGFAMGRFVEGEGTAPIPEPGTMMLLGSGLVGLAGWGRRRFKK